MALRSINVEALGTHTTTRTRLGSNERLMSRRKNTCSMTWQSSKLAMTPAFMGRTVTIAFGVRPSIAFAAWPAATTVDVPCRVFTATIDGSSNTMPWPLRNTKVFAVPRSMAISSVRLKAITYLRTHSLKRIAQHQPGRDGVVARVGFRFAAGETASQHTFHIERAEAVANTRAGTGEAATVLTGIGGLVL